MNGVPPFNANLYRKGATIVAPKYHKKERSSVAAQPALCSAGGPVEGAASEDVYVQVRDSFARHQPIVYDNPKPVVQIAKLGDLGNGEHQVGENFGIAILRFGKPFNGLDGEEQHVGGCLRIDVVYRGANIVAVNNLRGNLAVEYFLEKSFHSPKG